MRPLGGRTRKYNSPSQEHRSPFADNRFATRMQSFRISPGRHPENLPRPEAHDEPSPQNVPDIAAPPIAVPEFRLGGSSEFGFRKPSRFFDLPTARSESTATGFGIGSVSVIDGKGHQKSCYASSTSRYINNESVGLIIPWSQVRVLAGPPLKQ